MDICYDQQIKSTSKVKYELKYARILKGPITILNLLNMQLYSKITIQG